MKQYLRVAEGLNFPSDAVTQTMACVVRKGAGKTYLASMLAEQMLDIQAQVVILDPVGNWYGLRVAADGKSKGKDIFIAGGGHGDVPILPEAGARLARLVVEKNVSIVLDVSHFRQGERKRFAADFAEEFFHLKKTQRSAVHLFVEEAQLFAPQRTGPEEARMLGAFENIIRLGRNYGIGATLITQRPQSVNKEVLSQVECLCVLQVNGSHERKALEEWVQEAGADRKLVGELPGLARGEGFVWSPSWLRIFKRVRFNKKTTFDASATPEVGKATKAALLTAVDVEALKVDLQEVIASAEKDDPKVLRKRIAELERSAGTSEAQNGMLTSLESRIKELESYSVDMAQTLNQYQDHEAFLAQQLADIRDVVNRPAKTIVVLDIAKDFRPRLATPIDIKQVQIATSMQFNNKPLPTVKIERTGLPANLRAGARRMLGVLCQWSPAGRTEAQLAAQVQMKRTGGTWSAYKSDLKQGGYIEISSDGLWRATSAGIDFLGGYIPSTPTTTGEVVALWGEKLRKGAREMLDYLVAKRGRTVSREDLGSGIGMEPSGGTFSAYLSDLKQAGLILVSREGIAANRETLML